MKKTLTALGLAVAASTAHALPDTDTILFTGKVNGNTCSIEIVDPYNGATLNPIVLPEAEASKLSGAIDKESTPVGFGISITAGTGCDPTGKKGVVSFAGKDGPAGTGDALHALHPGSAAGVALAIKDNTRTIIPWGAESEEYDLNATGESTMLFYANLRSTAAVVTAGPVNATIPFVFDLK
ncbi:fimbrial protein [Pseudomonas sp. S1(2024)]|uniref:fimbrial protein n=1 Tax=Pseudomonas sp. S1(2024) TaxID=3390191 RepID=UPI00397D106B